MNKPAWLLYVMMGLWLMLAATAASAQSQTKFTIQVPFNFVVQGTVLPAGLYLVERVNAGSPEIVALRSADGRSRKRFSTQRAEASQPEAESKLVFNRIGLAYFLCEIWVAGNRNGRRLPPSDAECELRRRGIRSDVVAVR